MGYVRDGSPVGLLYNLPSALLTTRDDVSGKKALVRELTAADPIGHNGDCEATRSWALAPKGLGAMGEAALKRAEQLGFGGGKIGAEIARLPVLAFPLDEGRVVEVVCHQTKSGFFLVLGIHEGSYRVVSLQDRPPGIDPPGRPATLLQLAPPQDVISPYIPVAEEGL